MSEEHSGVQYILSSQSPWFDSTSGALIEIKYSKEHLALVTSWLIMI